MKKTRVWIGVGSNLGDRLANIKAAMQLLFSKGITVLRTSSIYETAPVGFEADTPFLNAVFECNTSLTADELLEITAGIEHEMGRTRSANERYSSRTIDLDILLFGDSVITTKNLVVPHPRMKERRFVLDPLNELIPNFLHPISNQSISDLHDTCNDKNRASVHHKPLAVHQ